MNKTLGILSVIIIFGCSNQSDQFTNGLTKKASKIKEYLINIDFDTLSGLPIDTLTRTEKFYNRNGQIIKSIQCNLYNNEYIITEIKYDIRKRIKKEVIELVNDSITFSVDYSYNGKFLHETRCEFKDNEFWSRQIGKYYYDTNDKLEKSSMFQLFIDLETKDTATNTLELNNYNYKNQVIETIILDSLNLDRNRIFKYDYANERLLKASEYNYQDSLISITLYDYQLDRFGNWVERKAIKNKVLTSKIIREFKY